VNADAQKDEQLVVIFRRVMGHIPTKKRIHALRLLGGK